MQTTEISLWVLLIVFVCFGVDRRIVGVAHVEDFESIREDKERAVCERKALEFGKMLLKERRKFKCIGEVVSAIQQQS